MYMYQNSDGITDYTINRHSFEKGLFSYKTRKVHKIIVVVTYVVACHVDSRRSFISAHIELRALIEKKVHNSQKKDYVRIFDTNVYQYST